MILMLRFALIALDAATVNATQDATPGAAASKNGEGAAVIAQIHAYLGQEVTTA